MARTRLFDTLTRVLRQTYKANSISSPVASALTRRQMLRYSSASAALLALPPAFARTPETKPRIAIIGGGASGLTVAYRLQAQGFAPTIFEASNRWGGRMFTRQKFYRDMFCEYGGEFIDTRHNDIRSLAAELGVEIQAVNAADTSEDVYYFGGRVFTEREMLDSANGRGAYAIIAKQVSADQGKLLNANREWTEHARGLDQISLSEYLGQFRGLTEDWAIDLLDVAYKGEFGANTKEQSCLNFVDMIGSDLAKPFQIYGSSDEAFRVKGGSSALIDALAARCQTTCTMIPGAALTGISREGARLKLQLTTRNAEAEEDYDIVVLALPFTRLRAISDLEVLGLSAEKVEAVVSLGYGNNAKVICGTKTRAWTKADAGLPVRSNGTIYTDQPFQCVWESSKAQAGDAGILTNFLAGDAASGNEITALQQLRTGLLPLSPSIAGSLDPSAVTSFYWERHPFTRASYACPKVGQYTSLLEHCGTPELGGRLHFVGEHTSPDHLGYMNGAVQSGNRAAAAILAMTRTAASR